MSQPLVDFLPTTDPLLRQPRLEYSVTLPILGIDTIFESNSTSVIDLAGESFSAWRTLGPDHRTSNDSVHIRLIVHDDGERAGAPSPVRHFSTDDNRLLVHTPGSLAIVDPLRRESLAYITTTLVADRAHFRDTVLEAITFALLANFDRHPIHAAAITRAGHAVLLAAPSGTGKSTLAYLAHRSGIGVLSDDRVWVQIEPTFRIWGGPPSVRMLADGAAHFPELSPLELSHLGVPPRGGAVQKSVLNLGAPGDTDHLVCDSATVCVMTRGAKVALERIGGSEIAGELARQLTPGFDRFARRHDEVVHALTPHGGWRLTLSDNPFDALPLLQRMLNER